VFWLKGKRAVVTGGASGIGLAIAKRFASSGARVALLDLGLAKTRTAASEISQEGNCVALGFDCNVSDEENVDTAFAAITESFGAPPDTVVNCARHRTCRQSCDNGPGRTG
jgi:NAD(P)-dependent dehydrogenase (short-subunit alcohol dehydrogenase family)